MKKKKKKKKKQEAKEANENKQEKRRRRKECVGTNKSNGDRIDPNTKRFKCLNLFVFGSCIRTLAVILFQICFFLRLYRFDEKE